MTSKQIKLNKKQFAIYSALYDQAISRKYDLLNIIDKEINNIIDKYYKKTSYNKKQEVEFLMYSISRRIYEIGVSRGVIMTVNSIADLKTTRKK